ncbi:DUF3368 domain-containing protein (plasmid) [Fervidibacter sacchari]|uniref:Nucleic acid-binding protein n=1 Tax=Candidatus Fervidibacter sacchari TaxID=1448929 RepID=A0ABT2ETW4_9BACT|nr:DUF3368 domain-containing protein [Candidatus Fervidibacter sacchari]MCS3921300.1 putative nucleic acid-binding protein [Candidatus Fervidibacter sacchari]WKU18101.1 DUF3368 domain-containing protein [Candidatus Fervidibacter sacchari]
MKEPAVADSTCLIGLERIGRLDLLKALFEPIIIPPKVQEEFGATLEWLKVQTPSNQMLVNVLKFVVDEGEAEAIALALEKGWRLIVDDRKARIWAKRLGIKVIGTAGILVRSKRAGLVSSIKPLLEALKQTGFHLSSDLVEEVLRLVGED